MCLSHSSLPRLPDDVWDVIESFVTPPWGSCYHCGIIKMFLQSHEVVLNVRCEPAFFEYCTCEARRKNLG